MLIFVRKRTLALLRLRDPTLRKHHTEKIPTRFAPRG
jgi:hypothetical protein